MLWHGSRMRDLYGLSTVTQQVIGLLAMIPDATWMPHYIFTVENANEGGRKVAVR